MRGWRSWWGWGRSKASPEHLNTGLWGEREAEKLLRRNGYRILGRRVRVGRRDEVDLIARDGQVLVFVEVKTRRNLDFGRPAEAVKRAKRIALSRAAIRYIKRLRKPPRYFRFDVVEVVGRKATGADDVRHIKDAFPLDGRYRSPC